jgi:predicted PurR-regulated permease PerM
VSVGLPIYRVVAWMAIIAGDVLWFLILLLATIGVASFLSDDRVLFLVTLALGFALPPLVRRLLERRQAPVSGPR